MFAQKLPAHVVGLMLLMAMLLRLPCQSKTKPNQESHHKCHFRRPSDHCYPPKTPEESWQLQVEDSLRTSNTTRLWIFPFDPRHQRKGGPEGRICGDDHEQSDGAYSVRLARHGGMADGDPLSILRSELAKLTGPIELGWLRSSCAIPVFRLFSAFSSSV